MPIQTINTTDINTTLGGQPRTFTFPSCFVPYLQRSSWSMFNDESSRIQMRFNQLLGHDVATLNAFIETFNTQLAVLASATPAPNSHLPCEQALKQIRCIVQQWNGILDAYKSIAKSKGYNINNDTFYKAMQDYEHILQARLIEAKLGYAFIRTRQSPNGQLDNELLADLQTSITALPTNAGLSVRFTSLLLFMHTRQQAHIQTLNTQIIKLKTDVVEAPRQQERHAQHRFEQYRDNINQLKRENAWLKGRHMQIKRRFEDFVNGEQRDDNQPAFSYISGHMLWPHRARPLTLDWFHPFKPEEYQAHDGNAIPADIKADKPITQKLQAFK